MGSYENVLAWRHLLTPRSSRGRWRGKSHSENLVLSGNAKTIGILLGNNRFGNISSSILVTPASGTGEVSNRSIQFSISRMSCKANRPAFDNPVRHKPISEMTSSSSFDISRLNLILSKASQWTSCDREKQKPDLKHTFIPYFWLLFLFILDLSTKITH